MRNHSLAFPLVSNELLSFLLCAACMSLHKVEEQSWRFCPMVKLLAYVRIPLL